MDKKKLVAGSAMVLLSGVAAQDAHAVTQAIPMEAEIVQAIVLSAAQSLNFGDFTIVGAGSIVMAPVGGLSSSGITHLGGSQIGQLKITGAAGRTVDIAAPAADTVAHLTAADTMVVNAFNIETDAGGTAQSLTIAGGTVTIPIGATLVVAGTEAVGVYQGSFDVTVSYQ